MTASELGAQVEAAEAYEALFVPALFAEWAPRVSEAGEVGRGDRVLDVGCGTGIVAREASSRAGEGGMVAGVDPNPGMLAVARRFAPSVEWREGTAESIPFPDGTFDVVLSQFSLMFFQDQGHAMEEMLRVLRPGGKVAVVVWDQLDRNPGYATLVSVLDRVAGQEAADALRAPFSSGDRDGLAALLVDAGIHGAEVETHAGTARFPGIRTMVEAEIRGWLPVVGVSLPEDLIHTTLEAAEEELSGYVTPDGAVSFPTSAHVASGRSSDLRA